MPYIHKEAFCLMKYASKDGKEVEWLWNSRDGVTPFGLRNRAKTDDLFHVDWQLDRCLPSYDPAPGERVFVSVTPEVVRPRVVEFVDEWWLKSRFEGVLPLNHHYATKKEAIAHYVAEWSSNPAGPWIITAEQFKAIAGR